MNNNFEVLKQTRENFLNMISGLSLEDVNKIPLNFNNNIIWNLGHSIVTQKILCYQFSGLEQGVATELISKYKKGTKPEGNINQEEYDLIKKLAISSVEELKEDYNNGIFKTYNEYTTSFGARLANIDDAVHFNMVHEGLHYGYAMALKRAIQF